MNYTLLLVGMVCPIVSYSQTDEKTQILQWQNEHPKTVCISSGNFNKLSEEEKNLLGKDLVVFEEKLTIKVLESQKPSASVEKSGSSDFLIEKEEEEFIKNWLSNHPEIRIVTKSKFDSYIPERKEWISNPENHALVLEDNMLTKTAIVSSPFY